MTTRILVFDPLEEDELRKTEAELDKLLSSGWVLVAALSGNRTGTVLTGTYESPVSSAPVMPTFNDYALLILHKAGVETG